MLTSLQVYLDQFVFTPCKSLSELDEVSNEANYSRGVGVVGFYFTSMTLMEGKGFSEAQARLEKVCLSPSLTDRSHILIYIPVVIRPDTHT